MISVRPQQGLEVYGEFYNEPAMAINGGATAPKAKWWQLGPVVTQA
jgi:hypothetical protein